MKSLPMLLGPIEIGREIGRGRKNPDGREENPPWHPAQASPPQATPTAANKANDTNRFMGKLLKRGSMRDWIIVGSSALGAEMLPAVLRPVLEDWRPAGLR